MSANDLRELEEMAVAASVGPVVTIHFEISRIFARS
jgi:hypothetical protein